MADRQASVAIQRRGVGDYARLIAASSPGASLFEADGVIGAVVPACRERSLVNSLLYEDAESLAAALPAVRDAYLAAGVNAWLFWVPDFEREAIALLDRAGYRFDGAPAAMEADLRSLLAGEPADLDWDAAATPQELGGINDAAYGLPAREGLSPALAQPAPVVPTRFYRARLEGQTACVVATMDHGDVLGVYFVATLPKYRGRGLTTGLMRVAFAQARERGLVTTALQASKMGEPLYERLGYRTVFRLQLWEYRRRQGE